MSSKKLNNTSVSSKPKVETKATPRSSKIAGSPKKTEIVIHDRHDVNQKAIEKKAEPKEQLNSSNKSEESNEENKDKTLSDLNGFTKANKEEEKEEVESEDTECKPIIKDNINDAPELKLHFLEKWITNVFNFLERKGIIKGRTNFCKHETHNCYINALKGFCSNFYYGFLAKAFVALALGLLRNPRKNLIPNILSLFEKDSLSFCAFLGGMCGIFKIVLCMLRRLRNKDDGINPLVAGFLSGLAFMIETSTKRKNFLKMYIALRALDTLLTLLEKRKLIKKIPYFEVYMFGPVIAFLVYCHWYENKCFPPGIDKAFIAVSGANKIELGIAKHVYDPQGKIWFPDYNQIKLRIK